jgi:hypothetical protein
VIPDIRVDLPCVIGLSPDIVDALGAVLPENPTGLP